MNARQVWKLKNRDRLREQDRVWRLNNPDKVREKTLKWREKNPKKILIQKRRHYYKYRDENIRKARVWAKANPKKRLATCKKWLSKPGEKQLNVKLSNRLRNQIRYALGGLAKADSSLKLRGCSIEEFKTHLESQFSQRPGASWETYGFWEIDHIRPCADFDLSDPEQQKICFHFSNLQVLWKIENRMKGAKCGRQD